MKRIAILSVLVFLAACDPYAKIVTPEIVLPDGLKDCKFYTVKPKGDAPILNIVRCPNSEVSALPSQKNPQATITSEVYAPAQSASAVEHKMKIDEQIKEIDSNIARLESLKKELKK